MQTVSCNHQLARKGTNRVAREATKKTKENIMTLSSAEIQNFVQKEINRANAENNDLPTLFKNGDLRIIKEGESADEFEFPTEGEPEQRELSPAEQAKLRVKAILPYIKAWMRRQVLNRLRQSYYARIPDTFEVPIAWLQEQFGNVENRTFFRKEADTFAQKWNQPLCEDWPEGLTCWDYMRAVMQATRHLNYGLQTRNVRMQLNVDSDHKHTVTAFTGVDTWREPSKLTFSYWVVENGDYTQPWSLEWVEDKETGVRQQIKVMKKVANVLKPKEGSPRTYGGVMAAVLRLKKGEELPVKFNTEHLSEVEKQQQSFMNMIARISEENNVRYWIRQDPENPKRLLVGHAGSLIGQDKTDEPQPVVEGTIED